MIIYHNRQEYDIQNWEEFTKQVMYLLGEGIVNEIQDEAMKMGLFQNGRYVRGFHFYVDSNGILHIDNDTPYAAHLEFGTYTFFDAYGFDKFPDKPLKKKDLPSDVRKTLEKGMMPFAPIRRVIFNPEKMNSIIERQLA